MDYIRILKFEEWRKHNDRTTSGKNCIPIGELSERLTVEVERVTHNGFFNQRVIGGQESQGKVMIMSL